MLTYVRSWFYNALLHLVSVRHVNIDDGMHFTHARVSLAH